MPMHIFISAGEPSGDLHGANLVRALKRLRSEIECVGFGGDKMESAGCRLLYPLCQLAVMWFARVLARVGRDELLEHWSQGGARGDAVDGYPILRGLERNGLGETRDTVLGRHVSGLVGRGDKAVR